MSGSFQKPASLLTIVRLVSGGADDEVVRLHFRVPDAPLLDDRRQVFTMPMLRCTTGGRKVQTPDLSMYRGMRFGMSLPAAAKVARADVAAARILHRDSPLIQELTWQPRTPASVDSSGVDPVRDAILSFYDGELYRIVVNYDAHKIEGMTAEDMVAAISAMYGPAIRPVAEVTYRSIHGDAAGVVARWEDAEYSFNLVRARDRGSFAMVLFSKRQDGLAEAAMGS